VKATITIDMDNAAFEDAPGSELARILRRLAKAVDGHDFDPRDSGKLYDINGNTVGSFTVSE
jgi:hypothetical protein